MATKKKLDKAPVESQEPKTVEVRLEDVLGALINAVNNQTVILEELLERIPPKVKIS